MLCSAVQVQETADTADAILIIPRRRHAANEGYVVELYRSRQGSCLFTKYQYCFGSAVLLNCNSSVSGAARGASGGAKWVMSTPGTTNERERERKVPAAIFNLLSPSCHNLPDSRESNEGRHHDTRQVAATRSTPATTLNCGLSLGQADRRQVAGPVVRWGAGGSAEVMHDVIMPPAPL